MSINDIGRALSRTDADDLRRLSAENERLRAALELIAGNTTDKLQALQARSALDNIGPKS